MKLKRVFISLNTDYFNSGDFKVENDFLTQIHELHVMSLYNNNDVYVNEKSIKDGLFYYCEFEEDIEHYLKGIKENLCVMGMTHNDFNKLYNVEIEDIEISNLKCIITYSYKGEDYDVNVKVHETDTINSVVWNYTSGNCSCDCNISRFIGIGEFDCGEEILIKKLNLNYEHR